jgi:hypothetical protein
MASESHGRHCDGRLFPERKMGATSIVEPSSTLASTFRPNSCSAVHTSAPVAKTLLCGSCGRCGRARGSTRSARVQRKGTAASCSEGDFALLSNWPSGFAGSSQEVYRVSDGQLYKNQPPDQRNKFLKILLSNCTLQDGSLRPIYKKPFDILAMGVKTGKWGE